MQKKFLLSRLVSLICLLFTLTIVWIFGQATKLAIQDGNTMLVILLGLVSMIGLLSAILMAKWLWNGDSLVWIRVNKGDSLCLESRMVERYTGSELLPRFLDNNYFVVRESEWKPLPQNQLTWSVVKSSTQAGLI